MFVYKNIKLNYISIYKVKNSFEIAIGNSNTTKSKRLILYSLNSRHCDWSGGACLHRGREQHQDG